MIQGYDESGTYTYTGELDKEGNACGLGVAVDKSDLNEPKFIGTFLDDRRHGICKSG